MLYKWFLLGGYKSDEQCGIVRYVICNSLSDPCDYADSENIETMRKTNLIKMGYFREYMLLNMKKALFAKTTLSRYKVSHPILKDVLTHHRSLQ